MEAGGGKVAQTEEFWTYLYFHYRRFRKERQEIEAEKIGEELAKV
jgi:hypothetical protein